ncbi:MAG: glycosyltransferase family 8 protein [Lentinula lateritia]|uniref:Glycosyltransferase family 8 protein n=1 Tax=Lentinula lateritia TaxID=40482 RepID=A0ABQ8V1W8_9AGAR|nr:MAG: glycosyltransferase family 8 protein [Lentinula lateritia]KAJ4470036.1 glycosyltransferase family 8 protein [Lentinula lateritia]
MSANLPAHPNHANQFQFTDTQDWFSHNIPHWRNLFPFITSPRPRILEIGSWEGRSAVFLLQNICGADIVCIDHFDLFRTSAGRERFRKINHNLSLTGKPFRVLPQFSVPALMNLLEKEILKEESLGNAGFDWIYIDGSHEADDTFLDGELAWRLARKDAIFIFDDYHWDKEPEDSKHHPKKGIDTFLDLHRGEYVKVTEPEHYQVVLRKTSEMRIGFLVDKEGLSADEGDAIKKVFGYGINVALVVDPAYATSAAVVILSAVENTTGRITIYIVDCGLSEEDKQRLLRLIDPLRANDVTMMFIALNAECLGKELGPVWAKLDLAEVLPIERVLYLDADTLIRTSIEMLWQTDLQGQTIAAAPDVGHPMGHDQMGVKMPYFNAGVMLVDLAKMRSRSAELKQLGRSMKDSKFRDQDVLNTFYASQWNRLSLKWNAQGLGTYARYPSPERDMLRLLDPMIDTPDPAIVHFTGPVNPSVEEVLSLYVQPPTAKPWGYLGAPGHPFQAEWWAIVERTGWEYTRSQSANMATAEMDKAISDAIRDFKERIFCVFFE